MSRYDLGQVVAERELRFRNADGTESPARVRIGSPQRRSDDWQCPYEIEVAGTKNTFAIYGIDSVQALVLAMKAVDVELEVAAKHAGGLLLWHGKPFTSIEDPVDYKRAK